MTRVLTVCLLVVVLVQPTIAGAGRSEVDQRALHQRLLVALNRGDVNDAVVLLADDAAFSGDRGCDGNQPVAQCLGIEEIRAAREARMYIATRLARIPARPFWSNVVSLSNVRDNFSQCSQALARGPDAMCVRACDASKESCERQCSSGRAACLAQCPALGFACDYYCHAAFYVCRGNCAREHEACVGNCPARGGEQR
jgi:hypothetical protein